MNVHTISRSVWQASQTAFRQHPAPFRIASQRFPTPRQICTGCIPSSGLRQPRTTSHIVNQLRHKSTEAPQARSLTDRTSIAKDEPLSTSDEIAARKAQEPAYEITFTCRKCLERSSHRITKQAYHFGTTLITCPGCKNRHLISDHLKIFSDKSITLEDILREKGQYLRKGRLGDDGDVEFYDEANNEIGQKLAQQEALAEAEAEAQAAKG